MSLHTPYIVYITNSDSLTMTYIVFQISEKQLLLWKPVQIDEEWTQTLHLTCEITSFKNFFAPKTVTFDCWTYQNCKAWYRMWYCHPAGHICRWLVGEGYPTSSAIGNITQNSGSYANWTLEQNAEIWKRVAELIHSWLFCSDINNDVTP